MARREFFKGQQAAEKFRGAWVASPEVLAVTFDFTDGTIPAEFTKATSGSAQLPVVVPVSEANKGGEIPTVTNCVRLRPTGNGGQSKLTLVLANVPGTVTRVDSRVALTGSSAGYFDLDARRNGATYFTTDPPSLNWTQLSTPADSDDQVDWLGRASFNATYNAWVAQIEVYVVDEDFAPYDKNQVVFHDDRMWESAIDANTDTPGPGTNWTDLGVASNAELADLATRTSTLELSLPVYISGAIPQGAEAPYLVMDATDPAAPVFNFVSGA